MGDVLREDHTHPDAYLAEVLVYDRLVVPIPPAGDAEEWERWAQHGWDPERLSAILDVLGDRAYPVEWNAEWQDRWARDLRRSQSAVAAQITRELAYQVTGETLLQVTPAMAQGVVGVVPYRTLDEQLPVVCRAGGEARARGWRPR